MTGQRKTVRISRKHFQIIWSPLCSISSLKYVQNDQENDQISTHSVIVLFYTTRLQPTAFFHLTKVNQIAFVFAFSANQIIILSWKSIQSKCIAGKLWALIGWPNKARKKMLYRFLQLLYSVLILEIGHTYAHTYTWYFALRKIPINKFLDPRFEF